MGRWGPTAFADGGALDNLAGFMDRVMAHNEDGSAIFFGDPIEGMQPKEGFASEYRADIEHSFAWLEQLSGRRHTHQGRAA